jgi:hypothetical protein
MKPTQKKNFYFAAEEAVSREYPGLCLQVLITLTAGSPYRSHSARFSRQPELPSLLAAPRSLIWCTEHVSLLCMAMIRACRLLLTAGFSRDAVFYSRVKIHK